ncbi:MAG: hypothetical protein R3B92_04125 [Patescibacteria group bacterium]|uniref:Uncharacterized protein n=1 Tax=candidate division WWE3 bacterium TaxID=2053526 RepID=A0A955J291_UNCKA|nr:hypothetical protein [candidate division WWE3 bacterium]
MRLNTKTSLLLLGASLVMATLAYYRFTTFTPPIQTNEPTHNQTALKYTPPLPEKGVILSEDGTSQGFTQNVQATINIETARTFYTTALQEQGWSIVSESTEGIFEIIEYARNSEALRVSLASQENNLTIITLNYTTN